MNFSDFCNTEPNIEEYSKKENLQKNAQNNQKNIKNSQNYAQNQQIFNENDIKQKMERYQNMSQSELFAELVKETNLQKQNGNLTNQKLEEIKNSLSPMMTDEQKQRLEDLIKMLR